MTIEKSLDNLLLQYPDSEECKMNVAQILRDIGPEYDS